MVINVRGRVVLVDKKPYEKLISDPRFIDMVVYCDSTAGASRVYYIYRGINRRVLFSQYVLGCFDPDKRIIYKNDDPLDCRKQNLQLLDRGEHQRILNKINKERGCYDKQR